MSACIKYVQLEYEYNTCIKYLQLECEQVYKVCTIRMWVSVKSMYN